MKRNDRTGPRLFLIEFLIVLFFFLLISSVCLRLFARAHAVTGDAEALYQAQSLVSSAAELLEAAGCSRDALQEQFPAADFSETTPGVLNAAPEDTPAASGTQFCMTLSFDRDFHSCAPENGIYTLTALCDVDNSGDTALLTFKGPDQTVLYELSVFFHRPLTRKEALL